MIVRYVEETNPDFVIMPGDQIETIGFIDYTEYKDFFLTNAFEKITTNDVENLILKQGEKKIPTGVETRPYHKK